MKTIVKIILLCTVTISAFFSAQICGMQAPREIDAAIINDTKEDNCFSPIQLSEKTLQEIEKLSQHITKYTSSISSNRTLCKQIKEIIHALVTEHNTDEIQTILMHPKLSEKNNLETIFLLLYDIIEDNENFTQKLIPYIKNNLQSLTKTYFGHSIIEKLLDTHPDTAEYIINNLPPYMETRYEHFILAKLMDQHSNSIKDLVINNFQLLTKTSDGCHVIEKLLDTHPDTAKSMIIEHFQSLLETWGGCIVIEKLLDQYPNDAKPMITHHFQSFTKTYYGLSVIEKLLNQHPNEAKLMTMHQVQFLLNTYDGFSVIEKLLNQHPDTAKLMVSNNLQAFTKTGYGYRIIKKIINEHPDNAKQMIIHNMQDLMKTNDGNKIIKKLLKTHPDSAKDIINNLSSCTKTYEHHIVNKLMDQNYDDIKDLIIKNFQSLAQTSNGLSVIEKWLNQDPDTAKQMIIHNMQDLMKTHNGCLTIKKLLDKCPDSAKNIINNLPSCTKTPYEHRIINKLMDHDYNAIKDLIIKNFQSLTQTSNGHSVIEKWLNQDPDTAKQMIIHNMQDLMKTNDGLLVIEKLLDKYSDSAKDIINNLSSYTKTWEEHRILNKLMDQHSNAIKNLIIDNFQSLTTTKDGCHVIKKLLKQHPDDAKPMIIKHLEDLMKNQIWTHSRSIIKKIIDECPNADLGILFLNPHTFDFELFDQVIQKILCEKKIEDTLNTLPLINIDPLFARSTYALHCKEYNFPTTNPTQRHIRDNIKDVKHAYKKYILNNPYVNAMVNDAIKKEEQLQREGYETFYHGRQRKYDFPTWLHGQLITLLSNTTPPTDFLYTHIKKPITDPKKLQKEIALRKNLIENGNTLDSKSDPTGIKNRQTLLFVNHFLFGNTTVHGCSSFDYMIRNTNAGSVEIYLSDIFAMHNLKHIYKKYEEELIDLKKKYNKITSLGQILQISLTPDKINQCVYLSSSGGPKESLNTEKGKIDNIRDILDYLKDHPEDQTVFVLVNTWDEDGGLNPKGMKITVLDPADHFSDTKKVALDQERDVLFAKIKADILATQKSSTQ